MKKVEGALDEKSNRNTIQNTKQAPTLEKKGSGSTGRKQQSQHDSEYQASSNTRKKKEEGTLDENSNHSTVQNTKQAPTLERKREKEHWTKTAITAQLRIPSKLQHSKEKGRSNTGRKR